MSRAGRTPSGHRICSMHSAMTHAFFETRIRNNHLQGCEREYGMDGKQPVEMEFASAPPPMNWKRKTPTNSATTQ